MHSDVGDMSLLRLDVNCSDMKASSPVRYLGPSVVGGGTTARGRTTVVHQITTLAPIAIYGHDPFLAL